MKLVHYTDIESIQADVLGHSGAKGLSIRFVLGHGDGAPNFAMMVIDLMPEGNTPEHQHAWEEALFVTSGRGEIRTEDRRTGIKPGDVIYITPEETHQFVNTGVEPLEMVCVVPRVTI